VTDVIGGASPIDEVVYGNEERLRFLVDCIEDYAIFMLDPAGRVMSWNTGAAKIKLYSANEIIGQHFSCFYPEEDVVAGKPAMELRTAAAEGRFEDLGWRVRKDGSRFWANVVITASRDEDGTLVGFAKITRDMTEHRRTDEQRFRLIVEAAPNAMVMVNAAGRIEMVNTQAERTFGYPRSELLDTPVEMLVPERFRSRHPTLRGSFFGGPTARQMTTGLDLYGLRKDGSEVPIEIGLNPIDMEEGRMVLASIVDISDRRQKEDRLRLSEERFKSVFNCVGDGIFIVDARTGRFLEVNEPGARMHGYSPDELIGASIEKISSGVPPYTQREAAKAHARAIESGRSQDFDWHSKRRDGRLFWSAVTLRYASISNQDVVLAVVRDVTERRAVEDQLRQAQKMEAIGQLTGGVAHDFNNLLAVMQGNLELLEESRATDPTAAELIADALDAANRGASLTHRLLAFSRQQQLAPSAVKVGALVTGLIGVLRRVVEESVRIETVIAPDLWTSRIDAHQLENALLNLAVNARDAMPDGGKLTIAAENAILDAEYARDYAEVIPGHYVLVSVSDTGTGMPKEVIARALEPFFTTKPVGQGTGLGLPMVYGFVKQSGGHLAIYSEQGLGTTVRLYLPEFSAEPIASSIAAEKALLAADGEAVVLVVEDDEAVRRLQLRVLSSLQYRTLEAADGPAGLAILESGARVDLLLTDIVLPGGMSGPALVEVARRIRPDLKVIFVSGYAPATVKERYDLSSVQILGKPFTRSDLARAIQDVLVGTIAK
jgi:PAS domain S-box-containing protein